MNIQYIHNRKTMHTITTNLYIIIRKISVYKVITLTMLNYPCEENIFSRFTRISGNPEETSPNYMLCGMASYFYYIVLPVFVLSK